VAKAKAEITIDQYQGVRMTSSFGMGAPHVDVPLGSFTRDVEDGDEVMLVTVIGEGAAKRTVYSKGVVKRLYASVEVTEHGEL
jgi:hypothetical protein